MQAKHEDWMAAAVAMAEKAIALDEVPVGAVLVAHDEIIGRGFNLRESSQRVVAHAEIVALESVSLATGSWRLPSGTSLYVTAEPCLMCTGALLWARVDNIYFGCLDPKNAGLTRVSSLIAEGIYDHRFQEVQGEISAEVCGQLLSQYFRAKRTGKKENRVGGISVAESLE
jgi:tRNA(adenine34) deaminase